MIGMMRLVHKPQQKLQVCEATYHVEVEDANGCLDTSEVDIGQPTLLDGFIAASTDEKLLWCRGWNRCCWS